jgi:membrane protease YdiL (CAAX protease family)
MSRDYGENVLDCMTDRAPFAFVILLFGLSVPFWLVGALSGGELLPGLPVSALMAVCPVLAASALVYRRERATGVARLLKRSFDYDRVRPQWWFVVIALLVPAMSVATYWIMRWLELPLPPPRISPVAAIGMVVAFLGFGLAEELGWTGYATEPLQARYGALGAALVLGVVWAAWHLIPLIQAHRAPDWIAGWSLGTVGNRVIMVWLFDKAGRSVFGAALYHDMLNVSWQLFPNGGSHYDPRVSGLVIAAVAALVAAPALRRQPAAV